MSTPAEEISVDLDAADDAAAKAAEGSNSGTPEVVVEKAEATTQPPPKTVVTPEEGIETLRKRLADAERGRQAAESRATQAAHGEVEARIEVQKSQLDTIKSAIERLTGESDALETQYADAMAAQDWKLVAKTQRQMSDNSAKLTQLEAGKVALEKAPRPIPRAPADPVEQFVSQLSPASASWVRAHPDFVTDKLKNQQMLAAHQFAIARGHTADSPEYFQSIEKTLDLAQPQVTKTDITPDDPMADAAKPANGGRQTPPAAAPVSRGGNGNGSTPRRVKLTSDEVEMAHLSFPDSKTPLEDYARQKEALRREGKLQ